MHNLSCHICSGNNINTIFSVYDDRYGYPGEFQLLHCLSCGHKFLQVEFSPGQLRDLYSNYYPRSSFKLENYRPHTKVSGFKAWFDGAYRSAFRWVPENVRVLDIGCGFGETLGYHRSRGCEVYGVEADENILRVADKYGFKVHAGLFDPDLYEADFFDYVIMDQVIEHMTDPGDVLRGVARVLKPGGTAVLSTPNPNGWGAKVFGRRWINWHAPYHLQHFSIQSIRNVAEKAGMTLEKTKTITSSEWLYYQWAHLISYPKMGVPSAFWSHTIKRNAKLKIIFILLTIFHMTKIDHLITRFFDALDIGDNHLFFLRKS